MSRDGSTGRDPLGALHIGPTPFFSDRGCHLRIRGLMLALERMGVTCRLVTYHHGRDVDGVHTERIPKIPGYTKIGAGPSPFKYLADVLLLLKTCGAIRRHRPRVLHGHLHEGALIGHVARRIFFWRRLPLVFDMQGSLVGELEEHGYVRRTGLLGRLFEAVERRIDRMPDRIACSSPASLRIARDRFGIAGERLVLVSDGVDVSPPPASGPGAPRDDLGLPPERTVVIYTGALLPVKGLDVLHEVIVGCAHAGVDVHFLLVGYPVEATRDVLSRSGLSDRCTLAGRVSFDRIDRYLGSADIAIEPKASDSGEASGKLLNYMAAGLPVVCFDTPNNREILGDVGCYASPGSAEQLVRCIERLAGREDRGRAEGLAGRERVRSNYSWDRSAESLRALYSELTGQGNDRGAGSR